MQMQAVPSLISWFAMAAARWVFPVPYPPAINRPLRSISGGVMWLRSFLTGRIRWKLSAYFFAWVYAWRRPWVSWTKFSKRLFWNLAFMPLRSIMLRNRCISSSPTFCFASAALRASSFASQSFQKSCASLHVQRSGRLFHTITCRGATGLTRP